jgi:hypothetical protein
MRRDAVVGFLLVSVFALGSVLVLAGYVLGRMGTPEVKADQAPPSPISQQVSVALTPLPSPLPSPLPAPVPSAPVRGEATEPPQSSPEPAPAVSEPPVEAQPAPAPVPELASQLPEQSAQLQALLQSQQEEAAQQEAAAEEEAARHAAALEALARLRSADVELASGDTDGVDEVLGNAESTLPGRTRLDLEAARAALAQSDLYQAREYIEAALAERRLP